MPRGVYDRTAKRADPERAAKEVLSTLEAHAERAPLLASNPDELEAALREEAMANALPNFPPRPGIHQMWASTTNQQVPVQYFLRLGYSLIKPEELPEFKHLKMHSAAHGDYIGINEMIAMQCPEEFYQRYMKVMHSERPQEEEEKLRQSVQQMSQEEDREGNKLLREEGDGFQNIVDKRPVTRGFE